MVEETREEFLNLYTPRKECLNGREATRTTQSAEGARAWSDLFVLKTLGEQAKNRITSLEENLSPGNAVVGSKVAVQNSAEVQNNTEE